MLLLAFVLLPPIELLPITLQAPTVEGVNLFVCLFVLVKDMIFILNQNPTSLSF